MLPYLYFFNISISVYDVMLYCGIISAFVSFYFATAKFDKRCAVLVSFAISMGALGVGSRLIGYLMEPNAIHKPVAFIGGLVLFYPVLLLCYGLFRQPGSFLLLLKWSTPSLICMQILNRFGCYFAGCCFGVSCYPGIRFPSHAPSSQLYGNGATVFPTQPLEILFLVILLALFSSKRFKKSENTGLWFMVLFGIYGFLNEFLVADNKGIIIINSLYVTQVAYVIIICMGFVMFFVKRLGVDRNVLRD